MTQPDNSIKVFISYSHADDNLRLELLQHLSHLQRQGYISNWHDRLLIPGEGWAGQIDDNLNSAQIILLLISSSFLASDYCYDIEMERAIERHKLGEAIVIPIILRDCDWHGAPFSQIQAVPKDAKPVTSWPNRDEAFADVARGIRKAVEKLRSQPKSVEPSSMRFSPKGKLSLAYLCDRSDQEDKLAMNLTGHLKTKATRPVVCLVHGDVREAHKEFMDRLQQWLKGFLKTGSGVKRHVLDTPSDGSPQAFWGKIGKVMKGYPVTKEEVWPHIAHHAEPLMFVLNLRMREAAARCESVISSLLKFCDNDWDDLPAGRFVIFFVCVKYEQIGWMEFKKKSLQSNLQKMLSRLEKDQKFENDSIRPFEYTKLTGFVLPKLESIRETHVDEWSQKHYPLPDHKIRALFQHGSIPMELLAEELEKLMDDSNK